MPALRARLAERLIEEKLISPEDLKRALTLLEARGGTLSRLLVDEGMIKEWDLIGLIGRHFNIPPIDLTKCVLDPTLKSLIPADWAARYEAIPISKLGSTLTVAMVDPLNSSLLDDLKARTHLEISPLITTRENVRWVLDRYYGMGDQQFLEQIAKGIKPKTPPPEDKRGPEVAVSQKPVVKATEQFIMDGVRQKASDVLIEPLGEEVRIRLRLDGILHEVQRYPMAVHAALVSRVKLMARLDIAERRLPQDGRFKMKVDGREVDFRVNVIPSVLGEKIAIRILDRGAVHLELDQLGFGGSNLERLKQCVKQPHGMILVCGPTGSGKSTTLYSILKFIDTPTRNLVTVEDPVELEVPGVNQVQIRPEIELTFASALRAILRQDPNVILVGEIRDNETVDIAIKAALTGHLVLSTLHTNTAPGAVVRLLNMGVEPFLIASSILAIASQRLVRRLCERCKAPTQLSQEAIGQLGPSWPNDKREVFHLVGCPSCRRTGYQGRVAVIELLVLTPQVRELVLRRATEMEIRRMGQQQGMLNLRQDGIQKLLEGLTTVEEVLRVTMREEG